MNNNYYQLLNLFISILILIVFIILIYKSPVYITYENNINQNNINQNNIETYNNGDEDCYWDYENKQCTDAIYKPSLINILPKTGKNECNKRKTVEDCLKGQIIEDKSNEKDKYFYCGKDGKCEKRYVNFRHSAANTCGYNHQLGQEKKPYTTLKECEQNVDLCGKYNNSYHKCLDNNSRLHCGWCTDGKGRGICISGTDRPFNSNYKCRPQKGETKWSYTMGNTIDNQFIM